MTTPKYKECILQIIDQLRMRKARPDVARICHMASRRHGMKYLDTEAHLEKLVDSGVVVKVDYKCNISYRNAAKWKKRPFGRKLMNSFNTSKNIYDALQSLSAEDQESDVSSEGVSFKDIEKWLSSEKEDCHLTKNQLQVCLNREVENGVVKKLKNGNYLMRAPVKGAKAKTEAKNKPQNSLKSDAGVSNASPKRGRPPSKRKRIKKTHGPDFEMTAIKKKSDTSDNEEDDPLCDYCQMPRKQKQEGVLVCKECNATAHPSCMGYSKSLARRALESPWQCIDCKTCYVCEDSGDPEMMLFCDACDKGYHMNCHNPPLDKKPSGKWVCSKCTMEGSDSASENDDLQDLTLDDSQITEGGGASCLPTPCDSPVSEEEDEIVEQPKKRKIMENRKKSTDTEGKKVSDVTVTVVDGKYPDASKWKVEDVSRFFVNLGFKDQAQALKDQEIDGQSLLLMKRSDVLTGLSIKLGPALKMYQHVMKLQTAGIDLDELLYS